VLRVLAEINGCLRSVVLFSGFKESEEAENSAVGVVDCVADEEQVHDSSFAVDVALREYIHSNALRFYAQCANLSCPKVFKQVCAGWNLM
jgi:hypothetical protein